MTVRIPTIVRPADDADRRVVSADRAEALVVVPLRFAIEIAS
jgi:hypothetical protein